jgi:RecA/RadA recombinase
VKVSDFVEKVNEKYGAGTLSPLSNAPEIGRIPTGILDLDVSMGGGFPVGRMSMVWGPRSSGKSTLCFKAIAYAQTLCRYDGLPLGDPSLPYTSNLPLEAIYTNAKGEVVTDPFVDEEDDDGNITQVLKKGILETPHQEPMRTLLANTESALDPHWCRNNGIDPELIYPLDTAVAEQTIDVISLALHSGAWDLIVLDSIAQMTPSVEIEESTEKWQQGQLARLMNKAFRIWTAALASHHGNSVKPSIILVNQERDKIGGWSPTGTPPPVKPGGKGQDFVTSMEIKLKAIVSYH